MARPIIFLSIFFVVLTILSYHPPHHGAKLAEKRHFILLLAKKSCASALFCNDLKYFFVFLKVDALSEYITDARPKSLKRRLRACTDIEADKLGTTTIYKALVTAQVKRKR